MELGEFYDPLSTLKMEHQKVKGKIHRVDQEDLIGITVLGLPCKMLSS